MSKKVILVTGGQRSGKSGYAQRLALSLSPNPVYLATSRIWDEEFRKRVERHQRDRGPEWTNIEEEKYLSRHDLTDRVDRLRNPLGDELLLRQSKRRGIIPLPPQSGVR